MPRLVEGLSAACLVLIVRTCSAKSVTIFNDRPRVDVNGNIVDAHDGMILEHNGTFFLYGERYGNQSLETPYPWYVAVGSAFLQAAARAPIPKAIFCKSS